MYCRRANGSALRALLCLLCYTLGTGCTVEVTPTDPPPSVGNGGGNGGSDPDDETIVVRLRNLSPSQAVDVEFYAASGVVENVVATLFVDENRIGRGNAVDGQGIGQANQGILNSGEQDAIAFPCGQSLAVGTNGGIFLDEETGEVQGQGANSVWAAEGAQFFCGATIVFEYSAEGSTFATNLLILR